MELNHTAGAEHSEGTLDGRTERPTIPVWVGGGVPERYCPRVEGFGAVLLPRQHHVCAECGECPGNTFGGPGQGGAALAPMR